MQFSIRKGGALVAILEPAKRQFATRQTETTEAGIRTFGFSQLYISLGDIAADNSVTVRIFWKPLVTLIWLGAIVMAAGGLLSLSDRRLRGGCAEAGGTATDGGSGMTHAPFPPAKAGVQVSPRSGCEAPGPRFRGGSGVVVLLLLLFANVAYAVQPSEMLQDPRARSPCPRAVCRAALHGLPESIHRRLRCAAAADIRVLLRERISAGDLGRGGHGFSCRPLW